MTKKIIQAASALNVEIHDHIIIGEKDHYSFKSNGLI
jgi:DNA repair protein RadC